MLKIVSSIPLNIISRCLSSPFMLPISLAFNVSRNCNYRCKTCNIAESHDEGTMLTLDEISVLFSSIGRSLYWITLVGGEPFLRKDLAEICHIIYRHCAPKVINIPSNGSLPEETAACVKNIVSRCPKAHLFINLSLDGQEARHDMIRNSPGAFKRLLRTYQALKALDYPQVHVGISTVISSYNIKEWAQIEAFIKTLSPSVHLFETAQLRDELKNMDRVEIVPRPSEALALFKELLRRKQLHKKGVIVRYQHAIRRNYYKLAESTLFTGRQSVPCFAGIASAYILPDGKVWACSNHAWIMGDLRDYKFNFKKLWRSKVAQQVRKQVKTNKCFCLQANANYLNLLHSPVYLGQIVKDFLLG